MNMRFWMACRGANGGHTVAVLHGDRIGRVSSDVSLSDFVRAVLGHASFSQFLFPEIWNERRKGFANAAKTT